MTSYQKLKDKESVLTNLLDNLYYEIKDLRKIKTLEDLQKEYGGEMPDRLQMVKDSLHTLEIFYNNARDDLWAIEKRK